jgi:hypothetical protein
MDCVLLALFVGWFWIIDVDLITCDMILNIHDPKAIYHIQNRRRTHANPITPLISHGDNPICKAVESAHRRSIYDKSGRFCTILFTILSCSACTACTA